MSSLTDFFILDLISKKIPYEIIEHDEITCVEDGVKLLMFPEENILKTIGFKARERLIFLVLQGKKRINYKKIIRILNISRNELKMLPNEIIENELGYQVGALSPLRSDDKIEVFVDDEVLKLDIVFCGIGVRNRTLKISSEHLIIASDATLANIT